MTAITAPIKLTSKLFANWVRIVGVVFAVVALLALSFALGRVTMGHTGHSTTIVRPLVTPVNAPASIHAGSVCHLRGPC